MVILKFVRRSANVADIVFVSYHDWLLILILGVFLIIIIKKNLISMVKWTTFVLSINFVCCLFRWSIVM